MECDDVETLATKRMKKEEKTIENILRDCEEGGRAVTIYGDEIQVVIRALETKKAVNKELEIFRKNTDESVEPHYWEKEIYYLKKLKELDKGISGGL